MEEIFIFKKKLEAWFCHFFREQDARLLSF